MFNGNKFMSKGDDSNLMNKKIADYKKNENNYHYLNNLRRDKSCEIIRKKEDKIIINLKSNRPNSHKKEIKRRLPNLLFNVDLNKLPTFNKEENENNRNLLISKEKDKEDISPEKYLEDILTGNTIEDNMISLNEKDKKNHLMSNTFKSSAEFDILKNTLFNERINGNKLSKSLQISNQNDKINQNESEPDFDKAKILNYDDIPIVVNNSNFMELLEKELANENIYNLKYNAKSLNISQNKNSYNIGEKSLNNPQNFFNQKDNYDRDDNDNAIDNDKNKERIKLIKIIKETKNEIMNKRSKTPENSAFKKVNKKKIFNNNKINFNENIPQINADKTKSYIQKNNINNNNNFIYNNKHTNPFQQKKIKNIINNNSITIISHFDIEEDSIKKNSDINFDNNNNNFECKDLNDSADKDITNYICEEEEEKEKNKKELIQKKINELNYEINKFKEERNNLNKTKTYYEKLKSKLISDIEIFNKQKEEFKQYIINEVEKVKIKQAKYKTNNKLIKNLKNENEILSRKNQENKEIIESLKNQIYQLQTKQKNLNNNIYNNFNNKKNSNYKFQTLDDKNNNPTPKQFINRQNNISLRKKLYRNRSSFGLNKTSDDKIKSDLKRINTFITEKEIYSIQNGTKEDISFEIHKPKQKQNTNIIFQEKNNYSCKTYEVKLFQKRRSQKNINNMNKNEKTIITKEKYNNILKLINKSLRKSNRNNNDKSFIENTNHLKLNNTDIEKKKKKMIQCKSNSDINSDKNSFQNPNIPKKLFNYYEKDKNNSQNEKVSNLNIDNKLTLEEYEFKIPEKYKLQNYKLIKTLKAEDKIINLYNNNKKEILFPSGVRKEIFEDGHQIIYFINGDIKQNYPCGKSVYYFCQAKTVQTTFKNGIFVIKFENNQVERHYPDGKKQILFPDGSEKTIFENDNEESIYSEENSIINYK